MSNYSPNSSTTQLVNPALTDEVRHKLNDLKDLSINRLAEQVIHRSGKSQRQESYKQALFELNQSFEDALADAIALRFDLHAGQRKKLRFKKDRIRILKQHDIDYTSIDGYETAQMLALIAQSIRHEDAVVTTDLNDAFPFWKEGYPMVQFDNTYKILTEDIQIHYQVLIDALLAVQSLRQAKA